jgi:hypothetical protein
MFVDVVGDITASDQSETVMCHELARQQKGTPLFCGANRCDWPITTGRLFRADRR